MINWNDYRRIHLNDGKHNMLTPMIEFPGYIQNPKYPFGICHSASPTLSPRISYWASNDTKELYEQNLQTAPADWKYRTKKVEYHINSHGYRTYEWKDINWKDAIILVGCSNTFGVGLNEDETYSYLLSKFTGRQVVNLGYSSASPPAVADMCSRVIEHCTNPYAVVVNWPPAARLRYYVENTYIDVGSWTKPENNIKDIDIASLYYNTFANETNSMCTTYYIAHIVRSLFKDRTKYISFSFFDYVAHYTRSDIWIHLIPTARDLIHPGFESNLKAATYLYEKLK